MGPEGTSPHDLPEGQTRAEQSAARYNVMSVSAPHPSSHVHLPAKNNVSQGSLLLALYIDSRAKPFATYGILLIRRSLHVAYRKYRWGNLDTGELYCTVLYCTIVLLRGTNLDPYMTQWCMIGETYDAVLSSV